MYPLGFYCVISVIAKDDLLFQLHFIQSALLHNINCLNFSLLNVYDLDYRTKKKKKYKS